MNMFTNLKATLLKVDLRDGKKVLVFETTAKLTGGELEALSEMIKKEVVLGIDSQVISYSIRKNAKTDKPIITYKVNDSGLVEEVKEEGSQAEMDLGLPKEKQIIKEEAAEITRTVVEEFILAGLAPRNDDYDFETIIKRASEGETYLRIASDLNLSSGKLAELLEDYFKGVAPLAAKWNEWREGQAQAVETVIAQATEEKPVVEEVSETKKEEDFEVEFEGKRQEQEPDPAEEDAERIEGKDELETFILNGKAPKYDDIPYDFPELLKRKMAGETWMVIATSLKVSSTTLSAAWSKYRKQVKAYMEGEEHGAA
jgi:hypothetical protein